MSEKYYRINEVAKRLGITQATIRHYEEKGLLSIKKDPENGYRIFTDNDIYKLWSIAFHRAFDMSIDDISDLKQGDSLNDIADAIDHYQRKTLAKLKAVQRDLEICESYKRYINCARRCGEPPRVIKNAELYLFDESYFLNPNRNFLSCSHCIIYEYGREQGFAVANRDEACLIDGSFLENEAELLQFGTCLDVVVQCDGFFHVQEAAEEGMRIAEANDYDITGKCYVIYIVSMGTLDLRHSFHQIIMPLK